MISETAYAKLKRDYRATQDLALLVDLINDVVGRATRPGRIPAALAEGGTWNANSRAAAAQGWIEERLLRRNDVTAAFDFASSPGPFYSSLERSFRHYLLNAAGSTEVQNLVERANEVMRELDQFDAWPLSGAMWWGLSAWRAKWGDEPESWNASDEELVARAWAAGEFTISRYGPQVGRASPVLERHELTRFLEALFENTQALIDNPRLRTVFARRFGAGEAVRAVELFDEAAGAGEGDASAGIEESEVSACAVLLLEEITARQAEVLRRKYSGETLEEIASALGIARGTVDNELTRIGDAAKDLAGDYSERQILEKVFDLLS